RRAGEDGDVDQRRVEQVVARQVCEVVEAHDDSGTGYVGLVKGEAYRVQEGIQEIDRREQRVGRQKCVRDPRLATHRLSRITRHELASFCLLQDLVAVGQVFQLFLRQHELASHLFTQADV